MNPLSAMMLACWLVLGAAVTLAAAPWHQASSPFRAEFAVSASPGLPEAGIMVNVPVCGLGAADGSDLFAFDAAGQPLALLPLGESLDNTALAVVRAPAAGDRLFLYFGSGIKSPHNRTFFKPGLTVDVRSCPGGSLTGWDTVRPLLDKSRRLARLRVDQVALVGNPVNSSEAVLMVFEGWLRLPERTTLMLVTRDAGYLFVDGQRVISRNGRHPAADAVRGEYRTTLDFTAGQPRPFRLVTTNPGGGPLAVLASWDKNGWDKKTLPPGAFQQSGAASLLAVAGRDAGRPCPAFRCRPVSYIGYRDIQYTEVECATVDGQPAEWRFGDGSRLAGGGVRKICVGLGDLEVSAARGGVTAAGLIRFPENAPPALSVGRHADYRHYLKLMLQEPPGRLAPATLAAYRQFLDFNNWCPEQVPILQALVRSAKDPTQRLPFQLQLGRCAGTELAEQTYAAALATIETVPASRGELMREYAEFLLYRKLDAAAAAALLRTAGADPDLASARLDLALRQNDLPAARQGLDAMIARARRGNGDPRAAAVRVSAIRERLPDLLTHAFRDEYLARLLEWERLAPEDRRDGAWSLARARLYRRQGWHAGALAILDDAIRLNPLLPCLPEAEYERGLLLLDLKEKAQARAVFEHIVKDYPNHPVAGPAQERLTR